MRLLFALFRFLLSLRYRVLLRNTELLSSGDPILFLANHQAVVDPQILLSHLFRYRAVSPVMYESYYNAPVLHTLLKHVHVVTVPDAEDGNVHDPQALFRNIGEALESGRSVLLYPSGQIAGQGREAIFGKKSAHAVVSALPPGVRVVGVRMQGLWGSMWSRAWTGRTPGLPWTFLKAALYILANGILFAPRRTVTIDFEDLTEEAKRQSTGDVRTFNAYLENFFNAKGDEPVLFLKHFFYVPASRRTLPEHIEFSDAEMHTVQTISLDELDPGTVAFTREKIAAMKNIDPRTVTTASHLVLDLQFDSLDLAQITTVLQQKYPHASHPPLTRLKTVADLCLMAQGKMVGEAPLPACHFDRDMPRGDRIAVRREPIVRQFLRTFTTHGSEVFCYDAHGGSTTRRAFLLRAIVASLLLKKLMRETHVGIMLPALQSTTLVIAALYLARKIPVLLNWTMGEAAMRHCMQTVRLRKILTVRAFFETVKEQIPEEMRGDFVFLDDELKTLPLWTKVRGFLLARAPRLFFAHAGNQRAVVLFTSGSEALPKAVPLTEKHLLADLEGTLAVFPISAQERLLSFLPPFHSFGFTITCMLPLLTGLRTAYTPNPADPRTNLRLLKHTKTTILPTTPTFLKLMLATGTPADVASLRTIVTGAEACPEELWGQLQKRAPQVTLLEGYGITECSPVVTFNPPDRPRKGSVGIAIPGVELTVTEVESLTPVARGTQGMLHVRGDNVFDGYLDAGLASPFVTIDGQRFYKTGDLGYLDGDGYLFITGRLKRFIKIAGEMISLPSIETILLKKYGDPKETVLAVEGSDQVDPPRIVLFATRPMDRNDVNAYMRSQGVPPLATIHEVRSVDAIPLLGTGKVDYKFLKKQIA